MKSEVEIKIEVEMEGKVEDGTECLCRNLLGICSRAYLCGLIGFGSSQKFWDLIV